MLTVLLDRILKNYKTSSVGLASLIVALLTTQGIIIDQQVVIYILGLLGFFLGLFAKDK